MLQNFLYWFSFSAVIAISIVLLVNGSARRRGRRSLSLRGEVILCFIQMIFLIIEFLTIS